MYKRQDIIDVGVANGDQAYILERGLQMVFCAGISLVLGIGYARFAALCGQGLGAELRKAEYRKIQEFSFSNTDKFSTSSLEMCIRDSLWGEEVVEANEKTGICNSKR